MTSIANTAEGRTLPRYCMYLGVGLPEGKTIKGINLVSIVPKTTTAIVIICSGKVILFHSLSIGKS